MMIFAAAADGDDYHDAGDDSEVFHSFKKYLTFNN